MKLSFLTLLLPTLILAFNAFAVELSLPAAHIESAQRAKAAFERGEFAEAERIYEAILADAPKSAFVLSNLGVTRFRAGKLKLAEDALRRAIAAAPDDDFSHCTLGIVFYGQARYDEAMSALAKALAINPKNASAHRYLGVVAAQKGWTEAAEKAFKAAEELAPSPERVSNLGDFRDFLTPLERSRLEPPRSEK